MGSNVRRRDLNEKLSEEWNTRKRSFRVDNLSEVKQSAMWKAMQGSVSQVRGKMRVAIKRQSKTIKEANHDEEDTPLGIRFSLYVK